MTFNRDEVITLPKWLVALVIPVIVSAITTWGIFTAKQARIDEKIAQIEKVQSVTVSKAENVLMIQNLQIQLDNIKAGIDNIDKKVDEHMNNDKN